MASTTQDSCQRGGKRFWGEGIRGLGVEKVNACDFAKLKIKFVVLFLLYPL